MPSRPVAIGSALLLATLTLPWGNALASGLDDFFREGTVRDAALSPEGSRAAIVYHTDEGLNELLEIIDTGKPTDSKATRRIVVGATDKLEVKWVTWVTENRLLLGILVKTGKLPSARIEALDADGTNIKVMFADSKRMLSRSVDLGRIAGDVPDSPTRVIMPAWSEFTLDLFNVDVITGNAQPIAKGRTNTIGWEVKAGKPVIRYDASANGRAISVYGRAGDAEDSWVFITKYSLEELEQPDWSYAGPGSGAGEIYVRMRKDGDDTAGIYAYDIKSKKTGDLIARAPSYDMTSAINFSGNYAGAAYVRDTLIYLMKDPLLQRHIDGLDNYFKQQANVRIIGIDHGEKYLLLEVDGPRDPGDYYLYDVARAHLDLLRSARPWLEPEHLAATTVRKLATRDGTQITTYLTGAATPPTTRPLVVMPHGGPELRDTVGFDPLVQAFAAQGWQVLQVNFRGSDGYGKQFAEAGHRQWSLRMQDDITDAVRELIASHYVLPEKIVIYGASYGGYAALAGAVMTPDLYRAAVSRAGVSDLAAFLRFEHYRDDGDALLYDHWVNLIGDPSKDADAIHIASPSERAAEIKIPILLIHGSADNVVPAQQSRIMKAALERAHKNVQLEIVAEEGHSYWDKANDIKQANDSINFFKKVLD